MIIDDGKSRQDSSVVQRAMFLQTPLSLKKLPDSTLTCKFIGLLIPQDMRKSRRMKWRFIPFQVPGARKAYGRNIWAIPLQFSFISNASNNK